MSGADLFFGPIYPVWNPTGADLDYADLTGADLSHAVLPFANLSYANLFSADLSTSAHWSGQSGATWTGAKYSLNAVDNSGNPIADTIFPSSMDRAWRDAAGMVAVPEPNTAVLLAMGLVGLAGRRRRAH